MLSLRQSVASLSSPPESPASQTTVTSSSNSLQPTILEFASLKESLEAFVNIVSKEFQSTGVVKLYCSLPSYDEWSASPNQDMHDLYDLHARLIGFLRTAVQKLRALKISATYHLSPCQSGSSVALVRAVRPSPLSSCTSVWSDPALLSNGPVAQEDRSKVFLASIGNVPTLITS